MLHAHANHDNTPPQECPPLKHVAFFHSKDLEDYSEKLGFSLEFSVVFNGPVILEVEHHSPIPKDMLNLCNSYSFEDHEHWTQQYSTNHPNLAFQIALISETVEWRKRAALYQKCLQKVPSFVQKVSYNLEAWESIIARFNQLALLRALSIEDYAHHKFLKGQQLLFNDALRQEGSIITKRVQFLNSAIQAYRENIKRLFGIERSLVKDYDADDAEDERIAKLPCDMCNYTLSKQLEEICGLGKPAFSHVALKLQGASA